MILSQASMFMVQILLGRPSIFSKLPTREVIHLNRVYLHVCLQKTSYVSVRSIAEIRRTGVQSIVNLCTVYSWKNIAEKTRVLWHPRSLISIILVHFLDSIIVVVSACLISRLDSFWSWPGFFQNNQFGNHRRQILSWRGFVLIGKYVCLWHMTSLSSVESVM